MTAEHLGGRHDGKKIEPSRETVDVVADIVQKGGIIVFPWGKLERRALAFMCDSANREACRRMNRIKTRGEEQILAVNGYPELITEIARVEDSIPLMRAAHRLRVEPVEVLRRCMAIGAVSFIFEARDSIPETVVGHLGDKKTVMVAGETDQQGFDFYTELVRNLHRRRIVTAGSSANRTTVGTYHVFEQDRAYEDLAPDVDLFIFHNPLPKKPIYAFNLESCSTFDMTVIDDVPQVVRFGSVHPTRFNGVLGGFTIARSAQHLPRRERPHHVLIKVPFYLLRH